MMNKRLVATILLGAAVNLVVGRLPVTSAGTPKRNSSSTAKKVAAAKKTAVVRVAPAQAPAHAGGQTATLMPDGRWLLIGGAGEDGSATAAALKDPRTGAVTPLEGKLRDARTGHTATLLPDGTVMISGGMDGKGKVVGSVEVFDPSSRSFAVLPSADLPPRAHHTATVLTDGRVLLVGGVSAQGSTLAEAVLWDPKTNNAESLQGRMQAARRGHAATLLPDGRVLVWRGYDKDGNALTDGEVYDPYSQTFSWTSVEFGEAEGVAPYVEVSLPQNGAADVPVDSVLAVRLSKRLDVESVGANTVRLESNHGTTPLKVIPAEGGMLVFVTPRERLRPATGYTLFFDNQSDRPDRKLSPTSVSFVTRAANPPVNDGPLDDEEWVPGAGNLRGDWVSGRGDSPSRELPALQAAPGETALSGQVLLLNGRPLAGVTLRVGGKAAVTDKTGRFLVASIPAGHHVLYADGRTANRGGRTYCLFKIGVDVEAGRTTVLHHTIWMPRVDTKHLVDIASPTRTEVAVTTPYIPGLEVRIPAGAVVRDTEGRAVTQLSITPIPIDRPPFPLPSGLRVPVFFTVQPGSSQVIPPRARVIYPNYTNEAPGTRVSFWNYDPEGKGWYVYGQGTVTADGRQVVPDAGVVIYEFTGFMFGAGKTPPTSGPPFGGGAVDGDPVDLATGLFVYDKTDLTLPDTMPLALTRTYRPGDGATRAFGIGTTHPYDMFVSGGNPGNAADLILPDGGRVPYVRVSQNDWIFESTATPTAFYKSRLTNNSTTTKWELALKDGTVLTFPMYAPLESIRDRHGNTVSITRTGGTTGPISQISSPNGRWIRFTYDSSSRITQAKDHLGRVVTYTYDAGGRLWKVTDAGGGTTEYTYDGSHRMLTIKDPRGIVFLTNEYDTAGRVVKQTQADATTYQFAYTLNSGGKITQTDVTDPRGNVRRVTFNDKGYPLTDTYALGETEQQTTTYERQAGTNLPQSITGPSGRKTAYVYDTVGNVSAVTRYAGTSGAVTTNYTYESSFNRITSITDPLNRITTLAYDGQGNLTGVTDPLSHQTTFTYNTAGQVVSATDALGKTTQWTYDGGQLSKQTDPLGRDTHFYKDGAGRMIGIINALGQATVHEYDALNLLRKTTDALGGVTEFSYDANGNLLSVTDPRGKVTSYTYNSMDRLATRTDPLSRTESFAYDAAGSLEKHTDRRGKVTSYSYDALGRLTFAGFGTTVNGGTTSYESTVEYTHDVAFVTGCSCVGKLTKVVDSAAGATTLGYDSLGRFTSETTPLGSISYTYDGLDRIQTKTVNGQPAVSYTYDDDDRLTGISQGTASVSFGYDAGNRRTAMTLPNAVEAEYGYDDAAQLTSVAYKLGTTVLGGLSYEYDAAGRRTKMSGDFARVGLPQAFASATYDDANQLSQRGPMSFTYDSNGNLTSDGANTYTWDARNRLAALSGGVTAAFQYDTFGRRTQRTVNGQTTGYLYDGSNAVQELAGTTPTANMIVGSVDEVLTRSDAAGARSFLTDGLGSTLALVDGAGATQTSYTYEPFGGTTISGTSSGNTAQYAGRDNDGTGLYYYRARYYSPTLQRFISEDPIGLAGGDTNFYAYVLNDPVNLRDPYGLDPTDIRNGGWSTSESTWDFLQWHVYNSFWKTVVGDAGVSVGIRGITGGTGRGVPGAGEVINTLEVGIELYPTLDKIDRRNQAINDALRCIHSEDCEPQPYRRNAGLGPENNGWTGNPPGSGGGGGHLGGRGK